MMMVPCFAVRFFSFLIKSNKIYCTILDMKTTESEIRQPGDISRYSAASPASPRMSVSLTVLQPLPLPRLLSLRGWRQYYQSWATALLSPSVREDVVEEIRRRVRRGGEVESVCRCGALRLTSQDAPRQVAVCHCSVCR